MTEQMGDLLPTLRRELSALYDGRLRDVYLYGSYARNEADPESDCDILIVLDDFASYGGELERTADLASRLSLDFGVSISLVFVREEEWERGDSPFLDNVREEAVGIHVPEGQLRIAQRFNAGNVERPENPSPGGTAESSEGFSRPYGT